MAAKYGEKEYGPDGFYFQQRRSKLDLRSISKLDLQKIVTDVDIESLQEQLENLAYGRLEEQDLRYMTDEHILKLFRVSQLTVEYLLYAQEQLASSLHTLAMKYAEKKRTVHKKRQEIQLLQDGEKQIKAQLKLKKMGIKTLENLIRDNASGKPSSDSAVVCEQKKPTAQANTVYPIKYYVTAANGICVEIESPSNMLIADVITDIKKAFLSRNIDANGDVKPDKPGVTDLQLLRLVCRGKQLFEESTLAESGVISGDSLVAMFREQMEEEVRKPRPRGRKHRHSDESDTESMSDSSEDRRRRRRERRAAAAATATSESSTAVMDAVNRQAESMRQLAQELRNEQILRRQLSAQLEYFEQRQTAELDGASGGEKTRRVTLQVGDIEDDFDGCLVSREEVANKLLLSNQKVDHLEAEYKVTEKTVHQFESAIARNSVELEELKKYMYAQKQQPAPAPVYIMAPQSTVSAAPTAPVVVRAPVPVPVPVPAATPQTTVRVQKKVTPPKAPAPAPVPAPLGVVETKAPAPVVPPPVAVKEAVIAPSPPTPAKPNEPMPATVTIEFTPQLNRDLADYYREHADVARSLNSIVSLTITTDISFDELIFELRSAIAEKLNIALNRVALQVGKGQIFTLGVDAKTKFSPVQASEMAASGQLCVRVIHPMSDAELDSMVFAMERKLPISSASKTAAASASASAAYSAKVAKQKYKRMVELLSDGDSDAEPAARVRKAAPVTPEELQDFRGVLRSRESLDDTIRSLSDKEGLTDDELAHQRGIISRTADRLSQGNRSDIENLRTNIVSSMLDASAVEAEVDGELHHLSGSQSNWFNDGNDSTGSGSDTMLPKMHLRPSAKRDHETAKQIRESQARQQMLQHQQDRLRARGLPPDIYDPTPAAAVGIASLDISDGPGGAGGGALNNLDASLVNQSESVLMEQGQEQDPAQQSVLLAGSTDSFAVAASTDSRQQLDGEADVDPATDNIPGRLDFNVTGDSNLSVDEGFTSLTSNVPSVTSTSSLGHVVAAGKSRYGNASEYDEEEDDDDMNANTAAGSKTAMESSSSSSSSSATVTATAATTTNAHVVSVSGPDIEGGLVSMDSLDLTASMPVSLPLQRQLENSNSLDATGQSKVSIVSDTGSLRRGAQGKDSAPSTDNANKHGASANTAPKSTNHSLAPLSVNSWDEASQLSESQRSRFDPDSTLGSEASNAFGTTTGTTGTDGGAGAGGVSMSATDSINNMYSSVDSTTTTATTAVAVTAAATATADQKSGRSGSDEKGSKGADNRQRGNNRDGSDDDSSAVSGSSSLLNTAELLKYAGVDLGRTADSAVTTNSGGGAAAFSSGQSSLVSSIASSHQAMASDINRENIIRKANAYEAKAAADHHNHNKYHGHSVHAHDRSFDDASFEIRRNDRSFGRMSSPGASSLFNDSTIHSNASSSNGSDDNDDGDDDDANGLFNSHSQVMNFDNTLDSTLNSNADSVGVESSSNNNNGGKTAATTDSDAGATTTTAGSSAAATRLGHLTGGGIVGALQDDNDCIEEFDGGDGDGGVGTGTGTGMSTAGTTLSSGVDAFGFGGSYSSGGSAVSGVAQMAGSPGDAEPFYESKAKNSPEFPVKTPSHGGLVQQPRGRGGVTATGTSTSTPSRYSGAHVDSTPQSQPPGSASASASRANSSSSAHMLTPAGASPFDHLQHRPNNLTTGSLEHSLSIDDSGNFDQHASSHPNSHHHHHLHGGDSLALSDSDNTFGDVLEDSAHSTYFTATPGSSAPSSMRKLNYQK